MVAQGARPNPTNNSLTNWNWTNCKSRTPTHTHTRCLQNGWAWANTLIHMGNKTMCLCQAWKSRHIWREHRLKWKQVDRPHAHASRTTVSPLFSGKKRALFGDDPCFRRESTKRAGKKPASGLLSANICVLVCVRKPPLPSTSTSLPAKQLLQSAPVPSHSRKPRAKGQGSASQMQLRQEKGNADRLRSAIS